MARQVIKRAHDPAEVKVGDHSVWICMCGLSQNQPYCDNSHLNTKDELEDVIYIYDKDDQKIGAYEEGEEFAESDGCCGGGCCGCEEEVKDVAHPPHVHWCCGQNCDNKDCCNEECDCNMPKEAKK